MTPLLLPESRGPYPVFVHMGLADDLAEYPQLRKRCNMRLRDLAARGTVTKVKSLSGTVNKGWLRTPLGGNGGNQFYAWWTRTGLPAAPDGVTADLYPDAFWVRAVRHHDDHGYLDSGTLWPTITHLAPRT